MYPFERFTERAKKVLTLAQEEAERSHHSYIGTEHLLLGLLRVEDGKAAKILDNLGVEIGRVRSTIESVLGRNERLIIQQIIPTSRVKKVIEIAFEEARRMGNNYVGTEHLLLGLLIEGEGIAAHVLQDLGANLEKVLGEIDRLQHEMPPEGAVPEHETGPVPGGRFGGPGSSIGDEIQRAAERLAAEQHTSVGVEHALLAALDVDPLVRRMFAVLGLDEAKLAELRRIATPPDHLVELRRAVQAKALELGEWRDIGSVSAAALREAEVRKREHPPTEAERAEYRRLRAELEEAERRWRAGEDIEGGGEAGPSEAAP
ncbi:MAG: Clp protease N-terminal domain-containing protein [Candidatus Dormibacteria bacterium]|jgi:ATP-dependent Clp protease ATP-binding subunit ClpA